MAGTEGAHFFTLVTPIALPTHPSSLPWLKFLPLVRLFELLSQE